MFNIKFPVKFNIWFRLDGELLFLQQRKKSNQKNAARPVCPSGPRGIRLCLRVVLTRRPGSTGLNQASCLIFPTKAERLGKLHGETVSPVKLAEDSFTGRVD
jgi:hypothetical protein